MTLLELLDLMKKRIKLVIGLPIVCALLISVYSFMFMPDTYTATTSMYVLTITLPNGYSAGISIAKYPILLRWLSLKTMSSCSV